MSLLKSNLFPYLNDKVLEKLKSRNISKITDFICKDPEDLAQLTGLPYKDVVSTRDIILAKYSSIAVNGSDFYNSVVESTSILTTGIKSLDSILDGGLYTGEMAEIAGDVAAGKTQICLSTCATTALQKNQTVVYIDTGAVFSAKRLLQMVKCSESEQDDFLSSIHVYDTFTIYDVFSVLETVRVNIQESREPFYRQLKLIIVDNIASVVYPLLGGHSFAENQGLLCLLAQELKSLAAEFSTAVLVTNNLVMGESGVKKSSLGRLWSQVPHVRLTIASSDSYRDGKRNISVTKNSRGDCNASADITMLEDGPIT